MSAGKPADRTRVTTRVALPPGEAFAVFTNEIYLWWRPGPRFGPPPRFEGGHLVTGHGDGRVQIGRVLVWEPGARLVFEWRARNFAPGETTEVEVRFEARAGGTQVVLEHRGFAALAEDHPVRHGVGSGQAFSDMMGLWWGDLMTALRAHAASR